MYFFCIGKIQPYLKKNKTTFYNGEGELLRGVWVIVKLIYNGEGYALSHYKLGQQFRTL